MAQYKVIIDVDEDAAIDLLEGFYVQEEGHEVEVTLFDALNTSFFDLQSEGITLKYIIPPGRPAKDGVDRDLLFLEEQLKFHEDAKCQCHHTKQCFCDEQYADFLYDGYHCTIAFLLDGELDKFKANKLSVKDIPF